MDNEYINFYIYFDSLKMFSTKMKLWFEKFIFTLLQLALVFMASAVRCFFFIYG